MHINRKQSVSNLISGGINSLSHRDLIMISFRMLGMGALSMQYANIFMSKRAFYREMTMSAMQLNHFSPSYPSMNILAFV